MLISNSFKFDDQSEQIAFMKRYSFATIITSHNNLPIATPLPFVVNEVNGKVLISGHFAQANEQVKYIEHHTSLIIFAEPHAYISPSHYEKHESVPTWDYISVHAYGRGRIISDEGAKEKALKEMIAYYEKEYLVQWDSLSAKFKQGMMRGIIAFELEVTSIQGKKKLSQNKSEQERKNIVAHLENSNNAVERELALFIKNLKP
ncbi:FMN-binding negative transcriptional regulator [Pedobacter psychrodurus]|uniref:FMN-binding negative transcriptional regulator n=1 Tax=Pedobacter psychrodurus TaxID=2530456 RepID=A0A4R0Q178_9SPHI|nr:FMN-binding negative transcriptional regulator [Pedobacter psychrodurus]TCD26380.1 FMN-binding negative transcriptional regulator [Pedobacter psychrodurus]